MVNIKKTNISLKEKILTEMVYDDLIELNVDIAKRFIKLLGNKIIIINNMLFTGKEKILLYLVGKLYSQEAGLISNVNVTSKELINNLEICKNSFYVYIKRLRTLGLIRQDKSRKINKYYIPRYLVGKIFEIIKNRKN